MFTVTRQTQWSTGMSIVEISAGGLDYTNPDALVAKYPGEFEEFCDPREAVETAIKICKDWIKDGEKGARIGYGYTGGMTLPFEVSTFTRARKWASETWDNLEKCPSCGEVVTYLEEWYVAGLYTESDFMPFDDGDKYCSEYCAEKASEFEEIENE